ncbi:AMP-binding protein [Thalassovita sp.]|jgi:fatty-acyl-CoA synthase|uniref:AMP-binding protein n=1 Tax=Thalassovita sp. TaxID=1979401 RepID=UPI003B5BCDC7
MAEIATYAANHRPLTPLDFLDRAVEAFPNNPAVIWRGRSWSYAQFAGIVSDMAQMLRDNGVGPGDTVAVMSGNRPEMLAAHYAIPAVGAVLNALNTRLDPGVVEYILSHSGAKLVLADPAGADVTGKAADKVGLRRFVFPPTEKSSEGLCLLDASPVTECAFAAAITDEHQPIALNYTSGTTGRPKGVLLGHRGAYLNSLGNVISLGFTAETSYLWTLPMFHVNGWSHTWAITAVGGVQICLDKVIPVDIFALIKQHAVTHMACAPVVLYMLLNDPARADRDPSIPVRVASGGAVPTSALIEQMEALGFEFIHLYGLTECFGPATMRRLDSAEQDASPQERAQMLARQGTRHISANLLRVVDDQGREVPADGQTLGEITLQGNTLMNGYHKDPEATEKAFAGGVFHTGDLAVRHPDNQIEIRDRSKDLIISGGENISSLEVEDALHSHPDVTLAAVVAAPDPKWGEVPFAFVETRPDADLDEDALKAHCRAILAGFKVPKRFVVTELPKTATGKIQKFELRQTASDLATQTQEART